MADGAWRVGIIGLGLIGGSIAKRLLSEPEIDRVVGFDFDAATCRSAELQGIEIAGSLEDAARSSEVLFVAVPPKATANAVMTALEANEGLLVTDVASIKATVIDRVTEAMPRASANRYLAGHPLAGGEQSGWANAQPGLLDQTVWALCPGDSSRPAEPLGTFARLFDLFDARLIVCDAKAHDRAVARTSHGPHVLAEMIAAAVDSRTPALTAVLSGGAFRDMTRIARSDFRLWREILEENSDSVEEALLEWGQRLIELARSEKRTGDLEALWREGISGRDLVDQVRWNRPPSWTSSSTPLPPWQHLLHLGEQGVAIRRARVVRDELRFERIAQSTRA